MASLSCAGFLVKKRSLLHLYIPSETSESINIWLLPSRVRNVAKPRTVPSLRLMLSAPAANRRSPQPPALKPPSIAKANLLTRPQPIIPTSIAQTYFPVGVTGPQKHMLKLNVIGTLKKKKKHGF